MVDPTVHAEWMSRRLLASMRRSLVQRRRHGTIHASVVASSKMLGGTCDLSGKTWHMLFLIQVICLSTCNKTTAYHKSRKLKATREEDSPLLFVHQSLMKGCTRQKANFLEKCQAKL